MWHTLRIAPESRLDFVSAMTELQQTATRVLILTLGVAYATGYLLTTDMWWEEVGPGIWLVNGMVAASLATALWLLPRRLLVAQATWQLGVATAITLAIHVFGRPEIALLYALLPLLAVVTVGWPAGAIAEAVVTALVLLARNNPSLPRLHPAFAWGTVAGGALTALMGWAAAHPLLMAMEWYLYSYRQARQNLEEARSQRVELKQVQEDLVQANKELHRLSERLEAMYHVAEEARRAKEEFVANVSHELRTPLNMIIGFSEMITQAPQAYGAGLPAALLADIAAIQRNAQHLARLVDDVLDLSQVEAGRMALSRELASLHEIIDAAVSTVRGYYDSRDLYLRVDVAPDLPMVSCDRTRVSQVVLNLLSNAGRFTERGGVSVRAWREKDSVLVSVNDTGPGIKTEDQQRIFEPFQQLDASLRRRHGGSGLGLSISKRFVDMHGGKIWLSSQVGSGTTVWFSLPISERPGTAPIDDDVRRWFSAEGGYIRGTRRSKAPVLRPGPRFVVLEEGHTLWHLFSRYAGDVEAVAVHDVESAMRELARSPAQALIVNTGPFGAGQCLLSQLPEPPYGTPVVACSLPGEHEAAQRLGVVDYLVKPVSRETLLATLGRLGDDVESVLVIDDEHEAVQLFSRMLSSAGRSYRILRATNGRRALSLLRQRRPDVVLLDLIMPGMDGFQILQEKSQDPTIRQIPVVVISSRDPGGEATLSNMLTVTCPGGISSSRVLDCVRAVSEILAPAARPARPAPPGTPLA